jgi:hypothetical protein
VDDKLKKIDILLSNESELEKYINELSDAQISYSSKLEEKILSKVNNKKSVKYANILKMVACMIVALILSQTEYIKAADLDKKEQVKQETVQKNTFINDKINEISDFFMKPINIEKGEK